MTRTHRKTILATLLAAMAVTPLSVAPVQAQLQAQAQQHIYTQAELDQMLAPIALYPDALLSQVLMAATYPIEVVEAARWSRANPGLQGDAAVRAVQDEDWDPSVKSLVAFPHILQSMDEKLEWTRSLGDAFLAQETQMMDQVQQLRHRAQARGNLHTNEHMRVEQQGPIIVVQPASPEYVYVPYYDPLVVYGPWWWPAYRPVAWSPWPGYARPRPGVSISFWWGRPIGLSLGFFFGDFDWRQRHVRVVHANSYYYRQPVYTSRTFAGDRSRWQHDPHHRRGVNYRQAEVRQRFASPQLERRETQRAERRAERPQLQNQSAAPMQVQPSARAQTQTQAQPQAQTPAVTERRAERRDDRRDIRRDDRQAARQVQPAAPAQAAPAQAQAQPAPQPRAERRQEQRAQPRQERRQEQRVEQRQERRQERREERRAERPAAPAPAPAAAPAPARQPQVRQEPRPAMPAAQAPQTPRAEKQAERQERREQRQERREERGQKG